MLDKLSGQIAAVFIFGAIGLVLFAVAFVVVVGIIDASSPMSVRKEIEEDHNVALAIIIGLDDFGNLADRGGGDLRLEKFNGVSQFRQENEPLVPRLCLGTHCHGGSASEARGRGRPAITRRSRAFSAFPGGA